MSDTEGEYKRLLTSFQLQRSAVDLSARLVMGLRSIDAENTPDPHCLDYIQELIAFVSLLVDSGRIPAESMLHLRDHIDTILPYPPVASRPEILTDIL